MDGHSNIYTKNTQNGEIQEISEISKKGVIGEVKISSDGKRIGVIMSTPKSPSNIYVIDMQNMRVDRAD